ncbi:transglycosylase SLT domain-containing protein [Fundidesulfovibrio terrae]|uniref:transglycosylase SLT domain-containing protein n=1 Tax=Fundidesulfovibrio terrae TaxID=2922866 RepID=UPI001FAFA8D8|nr:transglycosylase SLT domain-containing protein [Fundidesulfovibrio terrae]
MEHQALIENAAQAHGLPSRLVEAVAGVESGGNSWAFRYEPQFFARHVASDASVRAVAPCSLDSERQARATSWGLMQVMGATARGLGFQGAFLNALCDPQTGLEYGCRLLARLRDRYKALHGWPGVAAAYNAGSPRRDLSGSFVNQPYVDRIAQALGGQWPQ